MASTDGAASTEAEYDPKTDPKRRAKSGDPGWEYGYWADLNKRDVVTCKLCDKAIAGGIKRFKQHLAGGYGDVAICMKTTTELRKKFTDYLEAHKRNRPLFLDDDDKTGQEDDDVVEVVQGSSSASASVAHSQTSRVPSSGTAAKRRNNAFQFKAPAVTKGKPKETKSVIDMLRRTPEEIIDERASGKHQRPIQAATKTKEQKNYVDKQWALWFYESGIPFNAAASRQFAVALEATAQYGSGYVGPTPYELGEPLLRDCVKETSTMREEHERAWKYYGCTLMSDGWSDRRGRHLINFLVNSPKGTYFLESVDASSEAHDQIMLANLLEKKIEEIGKDKVVQVVTDNGANYKAAGKLLMERIPTLFWSPCAAHCLDLMLEDIGKIKEFKRPIARARRVTTFIYRHGRILSAMREKTGGGDLVRPAATRFATAFLTLKSLYKHKDALRALFVSEAWLGNKLAKTKAGESVHDIVLSTEFWNKVEDCLRASAPLLVVLRVVDGDEKPAMPEVAALMDHAKEKIKLSFATQNKKSLLKKIMDIIEGRWVRQMDHPLYGAALYLNPSKLIPIVKDGDDASLGKLRGCFLDVLGRMVEDEDLRDVINEQSMDYQLQRGECFSNKMAIKGIETKSPLEWWESYCGRALQIQRFARRIVSLCASSSGCERNWSAFEHIHTKKRNRLLHKRLNDIVYISYNRKMKTRFQKIREQKGKIDPLVYEEFDWNNEWVDSLHVPSQGGRGCECDVTWDMVDEAVGASHSLQGRNLPRRAHTHGQPQVYKRQRNSNPTVVQNEDDEDLENDDEARDPFDDADMSDDEDGRSNHGGEEDDDDGNNMDEFDDGY